MKVPCSVRRCIGSLSESWETTFSLGNSVRTGVVHYSRGLMQGDSLSPLLFCMCLAPISAVLRDTRGYVPMESDVVITHSLFMDDLKVYAGNDAELDATLGVVHEMSDVVGMKLGLSKCARVSGVGGTVLPPAEDDEFHFRCLTEQDNYKYLDQCLGHRQVKVKLRLKKELKRRLRLVWSSCLNSRQKVELTNSWAVAGYNYFLPLWE